MIVENPIVISDDKLENKQGENRATIIAALWCCRNIVDTVVLELYWAATSELVTHTSRRLVFSLRVPIENNCQCISMRTPNPITTSIQITFNSYLFWVLVDCNAYP